MSEASHCRRCGTTFTSDTAQGLCPACLLEQGLGPPPTDETQAMPRAGYAGYSQGGYAPGTSGMPGMEEPSLAEVARLFPQLEVIEVLGRGGMGIVYKARQRGLDRLVALKILPPGVDRDPGFQERFVREARALARLCHPNIVAVYDFGQVEGRYYFLMEYVDGANLRRMLQAGQFTPTEALGIVPQLCDALQFAHEEGIVHRDVKPENILVDRKGRVKIADFGLAKIISGPTNQRGYTLTESRVSLGTPHYMAPEQFERPATVDHRADIYSLGVVFYEMLTGELPLGRFPPPSRKVHVDVRLDEVVLRTLEKEPQQRYQHASQVKTDVASVSGVPGGAAPYAGRGSQGWGPPPAPHGAPSSDWSAAGAPPAARPPALPEAGPRRLSRRAVLGAVWALAPLLAATFVYSLRMDAAPQMTAPGAPPQFLEPPVFLQALAFILAALGVTAPVGTSALGIAAIGRIRRSRGRIFGLPLALADALLFPLLLLDVLIIAFWAMLLDSQGPETETRVILLGAITSLAVDAWIVRQVWRRVTRPLFPPAPQAHDPRDSRPAAPGSYQLGPRRSVLPWIVLGMVVVVGGLLFVGCFVPAEQRRVAVQAESATRSGMIVADTNAVPEQPGEQRYRFYARGPANCKAEFWVDYLRDGKPVADQSFGKSQWTIPPAGQPFDGHVELVLRPMGIAPDPGTPQTTSVVWRVQSNVGSASTTSVIADPFHGMSVRDSTWGTRTGGWEVVPGKLYTLLVLRGGKDQLLGPPGDDNPPHPPDVEIRIMARFSPLTPDEAAEGARITGDTSPAHRTTTGTTSRTTGETLKTPTDHENHRRPSTPEERISPRPLPPQGEPIRPVQPDQP